MSQDRDTQPAAKRPRRSGDPTQSAETLLELLSDEYARQLLATMQNEAKSARTLAAECDMSRPTVYRRLNRLQEAGLITERIAVGNNGHHRRRFSVAVENVGITLEDTGFDAAITTGGHEPVTRG